LTTPPCTEGVKWHVSDKIYHNEELMKIIGEMNQAQESNSELKGMNKDLAKQITKQQELLNIHQQASDQYLNQITVLDDKVNSYVEEIDSQKSRLKEFEKERFHLQTEMIDLQDENQRLREKEATSAEMTLIETDSHESMVSAIKTIETENAALKASNDGFVENSKLLALKNNDLQAKVDNLLNELSRIRDQEEFLRGESIKRQNLENQNSALVSKLNTLKSSDENLRSKLAETERKEDNLRHLNTKLVQRLSLFKECKTQLDAQKEAVAQ
jgi:chromosome segregation ATPase